jgi:hypothetical protein
LIFWNCISQSIFGCSINNCKFIQIDGRHEYHTFFYNTHNPLTNLDLIKKVVYFHSLCLLHLDIQLFVICILLFHLGIYSLYKFNPSSVCLKFVAIQEMSLFFKWNYRCFQEIHYHIESHLETIFLSTFPTIFNATFKLGDITPISIYNVLYI